MRQLIFAIAALFLSTGPVYAERVWICDGFVYSDESKSDSFILKGDGKTFSFNLEVEHILQYSATNEIIDYDIYLHKGDTTNRQAYYIQIDGNQLEIQQKG